MVVAAAVGGETTAAMCLAVTDGEGWREHRVVDREGGAVTEAAWRGREERTREGAAQGI